MILGEPAGTYCRCPADSIPKRFPEYANRSANKPGNPRRCKTTNSAIDDLSLPAYAGISLADVRLVTSRRSSAEARQSLLDTDVIGFDTESKPTFLKGEVSTGPHLIQLATDTQAFLFCVGQLESPDDLSAILEARHVQKVGFDIRTDVARIQSKLGITTVNVLDLAIVLQDKDHRRTVGAKGAAARFLGGRLSKSKRTTTSNWASPRLTERQILYAANDAQVPLLVYRAWVAAQLQAG